MELPDKTSRADVARARCHLQASMPCLNTVATTSRESNVSTTARQGLGMLCWYLATVRLLILSLGRFLTSSQEVLCLSHILMQE